MHRLTFLFFFFFFVFAWSAYSDDALEKMFQSEQEFEVAKDLFGSEPTRNVVDAAEQVLQHHSAVSWLESKEMPILELDSTQLNGSKQKEANLKQKVKSLSSAKRRAAKALTALKAAEMKPAGRKTVISFTESGDRTLMQSRKRSRSSKRMRVLSQEGGIEQKNAALLKVWATLNADRIEDDMDKLGITGRFLQSMAKKSRRSPVQQYRATMEQLLKDNTRGLRRYTLKHIRKRMSRNQDGILTIGKVYAKHDITVRIDGHAIGFNTRRFSKLDELAVPQIKFIKAMTRYKASLHKKSNRKEKWTSADFQELLQSSCEGRGGCRANKSKASCLRYRRRVCKWTTPWDGS